MLFYVPILCVYHENEYCINNKHFDFFFFFFITLYYINMTESHKNDTSGI